MTPMNTPRLPMPPGRRMIVALCIGAVAGALVAASSAVPLGILVGVTVMHLVFLGWGWVALWPLSAEQTAANARRQDVRPVVEELIVVAAAVGALVGIVMLLLLTRSGSDSQVGAAVALAGVFCAWASLHLMYAGRYAYLYYIRESGHGIDFNQSEAPAYRDFFYFSYNLGMTYQVSDTAVCDSTIRATTLRHCLLSYVFGAVVLASTVNLVAGIATN